MQRLQAIEDEWSRKATLEAVAAARAIVGEGGVNGRAMLAGLSEIEWGWIVCAAIAGWIKCKAQQAVQEGVGYDAPIRFMPNQNPQPWDAGAIEAVLPSLADLRDVPWDKPIGDWSKHQVIAFAWQAYTLVNQSLAARDEGAGDKITQFSQQRQERELMAKNGGPLASRDEMNDEIPF